MASNLEILNLLKQAQQQHGVAQLPVETLAGQQLRKRRQHKLALGWMLVACCGLYGLSRVADGAHPAAPRSGEQLKQAASTERYSVAGTFLGSRNGSGVVLWKVLADDQHLVTMVLRQGLEPAFVPRTGDRLKLSGQPMGDGALAVTRTQDIQRLPDVRLHEKQLGTFLVSSGLGEGTTVNGEHLSFIASGWPDGVYTYARLGTDEALRPVALELGAS